jgi:Flp pilus assembly protein TadD
MKKRSPEEKRTVWDWFTRVTAVTAFIIGLVNVYSQQVNRSAERNLRIREIYDKTWDVLGGAEGTAMIEQGAVTGKPRIRQHAKDLINQGLTIAPEDPDLLAMKGMIVAEGGDTAGAEVLYRRALSLGPRDVVAHNGLL